MATTVSDSGAAADRLRRAQRGLARLLARDMRRLGRVVVPQRLQESLPLWIEAVAALVGRYGDASSSLAADFYEAEREAAGVPGRFAPSLPGPPPDAQTEASLRWATKDLWPRDAELATPAQAQPVAVRLEQAQRKAQGVAQKLVLDQGRETVREAVLQDRGAVAYARAAALGACAFCKLMASRGAVYKDLDSVGRAADELFEGDASVVKFHDNCRCQPIPVFRGQQFELSPQAREWDRLYREYAAPYSGDQLRRFRQAIAEHGLRPIS